jgi:hypothetical protein
MATSPKLNTYTSVLWCDTLGRSYLGPLEVKYTRNGRPLEHPVFEAVSS